MKSANKKKPTKAIIIKRLKAEIKQLTDRAIKAELDYEFVRYVTLHYT